MITVEEAIRKFENDNPNMTITEINDWDNKYVFGSINNNNETNWDSTAYAVSKEDGSVSRIDVFNMDFIDNAKSFFHFGGFQ